MIVSALRMVSELERMGDLSVHVAKIARLRVPSVAVPDELGAQQPADPVQALHGVSEQLPEGDDQQVAHRVLVQRASQGDAVHDRQVRHLLEVAHLRRRQVLAAGLERLGPGRQEPGAGLRGLLVVARHAERRAGHDHVSHDSDDIKNARSPVDEVAEEAVPFRGGGEMIDVVERERVTYNDPPHRFEAGTPNIAGFIGLGAAVDYIESIGIDRIAAREQELLAYATGLRLNELCHLRWRDVHAEADRT